MRHALTFAALLALTACSQEVPSPPAPPPPPASAAQPAAPAAAVAAPGAVVAQQAPPPAVAGVTFSATVQSTDCSGAPAAVAQVQWDATAAKSAGVAVYVEAPGNARKLWVEGGAVGRETTGPWVFPQTRFTLVDKASGSELSFQVIGALACP